MKQFPPVPHVEDAPDELRSGGHVWITEKIDGAPLRFRVRESGLLVFGDRNRIYDDDDVPAAYGHAVRNVRERLDREALADAVSDPSSLTFFGEATHKHAIEYDWDRLPSVLGFAVHSERHDAFLPPDAAHRAFAAIDLDPVPVVRKEVRATDFDPDRYEVPDSAWYDGPAEGVVIENKRGSRAKLLHPRVRGEEDAVPAVEDPETLAGEYITDHRIERAVRSLERHDRAPTFDSVYERVYEGLLRERHRTIQHADVDEGRFKSVVAERVRRWLEASR